MSITVASIVTNFDTFIGDTSTDMVSAAERLQYITEATVWLQEQLENDLQNVTYDLNYYDNVHYYKVNTALADLLEGADLRQGEEEEGEPFTHKSSREVSEEIRNHADESSWSIEYRDGDKYLVVNHQSKYRPETVSGCDSTTDGGGTWEADTSASDATNLTVDTSEYKQGSASLNFDVDVSQSGNNRATITNSTLTSRDWSSYEDLASFVFWIYVPDVTYFSSITLYWGNSASSYWSATVTTDVNGSAFANGWNRVAVLWSAATATSSPDSSAIDYMRIDFNYTGSQTDDTDFRIDDITLVRPEKLKLHYIGWYVGTDTLGTTNRTAFTATTDIPYFSGQYDQYKYPVAHKAASLCFRSLRLKAQSDEELAEALRSLNQSRKIIPSSKNPELKNFKVRGVAFRRRVR